MVLGPMFSVFFQYFNGKNQEQKQISYYKKTHLIF